jgi:ribosomal protein L6P/L9E
MKNLKTEFQIFCKYNFSFYYTKNNKFFLVFSNNSQLKFLQLSNCINITKRNNFFFFRVLNSTLIQPLKFINFQKKIGHLLNSINKNFKKYLIIKGLGLRIRYVNKSHLLKLKLGFSNLITILVPNNITIFRNKNLLIIEGNNPSNVGNFANLIRNLKYPDSYKGKGFWYKNEIRVLKPVKKI